MSSSSSLSEMRHKIPAEESNGVGTTTSLCTSSNSTTMEIDALPLEKHHVVLGRYNREKKTKALTPAVRMYKKVRDQVERGKNKGVEQLRHIQHETSVLLQEELFNEGKLPTVTFWVDVNKAQKDGKLEELEQANPQLRTCLDFDGEAVVFVQDHQDFYLKADLAGHKKNRSKKSSNVATTVKKTKLLRHTLESHTGEKESSNRTARTVSTLGSSSCSTSSTIVSGSQQQQPDTKKPFQIIQPMADSLLEQVERICSQWIQRGSNNSDAIKRKTALAEVLQSYVSFYQRLLEENNPCHHSPVKILQQMNETILVQVTNTLGNSMMDWYEQYPDTCLPGEANEWNKEIIQQPQEEQQVMSAEPCLSFPSTEDAKVHSDSEGAMEKSSVGTYEMSSDDEGLIARHFKEQFKLGDATHNITGTSRESPNSFQFQADFDDTPFPIPETSAADLEGRLSEHSFMDATAAPFDGFGSSGDNMVLSDGSSSSVRARDWSPFGRDQIVTMEGAGGRQQGEATASKLHEDDGRVLPLLSESSPADLGASSSNHRPHRRWTKPPSFTSKRYVKLDSLKGGK
ncbi:expressed unknown protein [Seminavis robusta]|uniref:Uncharacterized protein n=1 Tax=Seminavis robusta TaxID=568900 RepID=A0A9N8DGY9_9STRA|nr:expressed unknown protein [Seminavis robusta]|eukprot:Sro140_g065410.1 n/a (571) ;mRNA; f:36517-38229